MVLLTHVAFLLLATVGFVLAGYLGVFEVLIELAVIGWTFHSVWLKEPDADRPGSLAWFRHFKGALLRKVLDGQPVGAAAAVVGLGVLVGWLGSLLWLFSRPWAFVIAREIKESLLDILIFLPLVFTIAAVVRALEGSIRDAVARAEEADEEAENPDPRDPEYWNMMERYGAAQRSVGATQAARLISGLVAVGRFGFYGALASWGAGSFFLGHVLHLRQPIEALELVRYWSW